MKKTLSIMTVALLMAGTSAFACGGSCDKDKSKKETAKTTSSYDTQQNQLACGGSKKGEAENKTACGGSKKGDNKEATA